MLKESTEVFINNPELSKDLIHMTQKVWVIKEKNDKTELH